MASQIEEGGARLSMIGNQDDENLQHDSILVSTSTAESDQNKETTSNQANGDLESPPKQPPTVVEKLSSFDLHLQHDSEGDNKINDNDNDSAKAGLDDSRDEKGGVLLSDDKRSSVLLPDEKGGGVLLSSDEQGAEGVPLSDEKGDDVLLSKSDEKGVDVLLSKSDEKGGVPLSDEEVQLNSDVAVARERHTSRLADIYSSIDEASRDHDAAIEAIFRARIASLTQTIKEGDQQREDLIQLVRQKDDELDRERQRHAEERAHAAKEWEREFNEAMQQQHQKHHQDISSLREQMGREAEQWVAKVRAEMQAQLDREREQHIQDMKDMRAEMVRLAERERETRERFRRAETMPSGPGHRRSTSSRDGSPSTNGAASSWAIARLWGVGQPRPRSSLG